MRDNYRLKQALQAGLKRDATGHMGSRVPSGKREGLILKTLAHPTLGKTIKGEKAAGYDFYRKGGKLYSFQKAPSPKYKPVSPAKLAQKRAKAKR